MRGLGVLGVLGGSRGLCGLSLVRGLAVLGLVVVRSGVMHEAVLLVLA